MITLRRILCPVDFSEPSERALRYALATARWHGATLTVLHVEDVLLSAARAQIKTNASPASNVYEDLNTFIADAGGSNQTIVAVMTAGDAVAGVLDQAKHESSDLIVMGTRGRSGLARAIRLRDVDDVEQAHRAPVIPEDSKRFVQCRHRCRRTIDRTQHPAERNCDVRIGGRRARHDERWAIGLVHDGVRNRWPPKPLDATTTWRAQDDQIGRSTP